MYDNYQLCERIYPLVGNDAIRVIHILGIYAHKRQYYDAP